MKLRADLAFLPLGREALAFSEEAQCLLGLNESAAFIARKLQAGTPISDLALDLASRGYAPPEQTNGWIQQTLRALEAHGMIEGAVAPSRQTASSQAEEGRAAAIAGMPEYSPFEAAVEQRFRLLGTCAVVRFGSRAQVRLVNSVIGHLREANAEPPDIIIDLKATMMDDGNMHTDIYRDASPVGFAPRLSLLGPLVKAALWESAVNRHDFLFNIHAGVVGNGTSCTLFPAAPGSGKSSLVAALAWRGFQYFSDEVALIEPKTFHVPALPLAMCIKEPGWELIAPYYPVVTELPTHRRKDGKVTRYIAPPKTAMQQVAMPVGHIIFPRYEENAPTEVRPVPQSEALARLMAECLVLRQRLDRHNVADLLCWIEGIKSYSLTFSSLSAAAELVADMIGPLPGS